MRTLALRRRPWLVPVSLGLHVAIVLALFVAGFWKLERLEAGRRSIDLAVSPPPPAAAAGSPAAPAAEPFRKKTPKRVATDIVLPPERPKETATTIAGAGSGSGSESGSGSGSGAGSGSGTDPDGIGECTSEPCGAILAKRTAEEPKLVPPTVIKGLRISGETQIHPPAPVKTEILRDGKTKVTATFQICVGTRGEIASLKLIAPSGYPSYDATLEAGLRAWRYRPYTIDARAFPVCGVVTFIYAMQ